MTSGVAGPDENERLVDGVIASAALDGRVIDCGWREVLLRIARGEVSADAVVAAEVARARRDVVGGLGTDINNAS